MEIETNESIRKKMNLQMFRINSGDIFQNLLHNFKNYDRNFLTHQVQTAYVELTFRKKIYSVEYNGDNGDYLDNYADVRYPNDLKRSENEENFPFPHYLLRSQKNIPHLAIVDYTEPLEISREEPDFDLFFALKLSLTDIMEADGFFIYNLENTFENDFKSYKKFIENISLKYKEFLQEKYQPIAEQFFKTYKNEEVIDEIKETNKEFTTARQVLAITYLLNELNINRENTSLTEIAKFIQFLTGRETKALKINDTTIYKRVKQPLSKTDNAVEKDLQFIRPFFEKLGLQSIINKLNKEIGSKE